MVTTDQMREAMGRALFLANRARETGDVPVGAVVLDSLGRVIGQGWNRRELDHDPSAHAEIVAMREAGHRLGRWNLVGCTLVVTLEPCTMCAGAAVQARVDRVVFGAWDPKAGAAGSVRDVLRDSRLNHQVEVVGGVLEEEASIQLRSFFDERRPSTTSAATTIPSSSAPAAAGAVGSVGSVAPRSQPRPWERSATPATSGATGPGSAGESYPVTSTSRDTSADAPQTFDSPLFARASRQWEATHPAGTTTEVCNRAGSDAVTASGVPAASSAPAPRDSSVPSTGSDSPQVLPGIRVRRRHPGGARH